MRWNIEHMTRFTYASAVRDSFNEARLLPFATEHQKVDAFELRVTPETKIREYKDFYLNNVHHFEIPEPHDHLTVASRLQITTHPPTGLPRDARTAPMAALKDAIRVGRCYDFLQNSRYVDTTPETWRLAIDAADGEDDVWQCAWKLANFVHGHVSYESHSTRVHTHMREVLERKRGVCQDMAHVLIGLCRSLRIPALYVSGYLATEKASATHAWTEVFVPGAGWQPLDPTHNRQPDESYIKIAVGRDYADVPPFKGAYKGTTEHKMSVAVRIEPR
jgi:transglutaminase-like putative cysteine protease